MKLYLDNESKKNAEVDSKETFLRFALDGIATSGFGLELNTFDDPDSLFVKQVKEIMRAPGSESGSGWEMFKLILGAIVPLLKKIIRVLLRRDDDDDDANDDAENADDNANDNTENTDDNPPSGRSFW